MHPPAALYCRPIKRQHCTGHTPHERAVLATVHQLAGVWWWVARPTAAGCLLLLLLYSQLFFLLLLFQDLMMLYYWIYKKVLRQNGQSSLLSLLMDERDIYEQRSVYRDIATFFKGFLSQVKDADMYKSAVGVNFLLHLLLGFSGS